MFRKTLCAGLAACLAVSPVFAADGFPAMPMSVYGYLSERGSPLAGYAVTVTAGAYSGTLVTDANGRFGGMTAFDARLAIPQFSGNLSWRVAGPRAGAGALSARNVDGSRRAAGCAPAAAVTFASLSCRYDLDINPSALPDGGAVAGNDVVDLAPSTVASGATLSLSGSSVRVVGTGTGSIAAALSGAVLGTSSGVTGIRAEGDWGGDLVAPTSVPNRPEAGFFAAQGLGNAPSVAFSVDAGSSVGLVPVGGYFEISVPVALADGSVLKLFRSHDGAAWAPNSPDASCVVAAGACSFRTDHLSFFSAASAPSAAPVSGGGGGGGASVDACPGGDFSPSYYDRTCGVPTGSGVGTGASAASFRGAHVWILDLSASKLDDSRKRLILRDWGRVRVGVHYAKDKAGAVRIATAFYADARAALPNEGANAKVRVLAADALTRMRALSAPIALR